MIFRFPAIVVVATAAGNTLSRHAGKSLAFSLRAAIARKQQQPFARSVCVLASSNLNFAEPEEAYNNEDNDSLSRWEEMYQKGEEARQQQIFSTKSSSSSSSSSSNDGSSGSASLEQTKMTAPVRVVTFDLDNTLWKTSETIGAANDALAEYLSTQTSSGGSPLVIPRRVEKVMGDLFRADRRLYCPLLGASVPIQLDDQKESTEESELLLSQTLKSPVALTRLRIDALCYVLETENSFTPESAMEFAREAFGVWKEARHSAILDHLAPRVEETLRGIRDTIACQTDAETPVLLGAITDGNSDPLGIDLLAPYFDFCVNAESVGVSKPDKRVYLEAARTALRIRPGLFPSETEDHETIDDEALERLLGPYWCHIGDDFLKDMVAAKDLNLRTIFAVELVKDKLLASNDNPDDTSSKEMDMKEFLQKVSSQTVITLGIGADDYLAKSLHREFVDAVADDFAAIGTILRDWHEEASPSEARSPREGTEAISSNSDQPEKARIDPSSIVEVIEPSETANSEDSTVAPPQQQQQQPQPLSVVANQKPNGELDFVVPRAFRIIREDRSMDVPAPLRNRDERTMKDVMGLAQTDTSSGVFAFDPDDVQALRAGKRVLMVRIAGTGESGNDDDNALTFSKDIFSSMSVEEVLGLTEENPLKLSLYTTEASDQPSFDLF
eukprot:CAMPEP_0172360844 /NCGR_PEP_ID=MMETSP1060-20121228/4788_1 /TAXON_ID=37318 /ORGANISM="Pseudo-nitzschia pungens, Strain cf. cingulata" /LENGTH=670 /DNA_ID=CAMNT_0013082933 /DNA_START=55 /DNA_END=2067 /DNA_ORIENTATION=-